MRREERHKLHRQSLRIDNLRSRGSGSGSVDSNQRCSARLRDQSCGFAGPRLSTINLTRNRDFPPCENDRHCEVSSEHMIRIPDRSRQQNSHPQVVEGVLHNSFFMGGNEAIPFSCDSPSMSNGPPTPVAPSQPEAQFDSVPSLDEGSGALPQSTPLELEPFLTNEMPRGRFILFNLLSTWGDLNEVGLNGIEVFDEKGDRIIPPAELLEEKVVDRAKQQQEEKVRIEGGFTNVSYCAPNNQLLLIVEHPTPYEMASEMEMATAAARNDLARMSYDEDALVSTAHGNSDPRRCVSNIINGVNNTHDETCLFTMPYSVDNHHLIGFILPFPVTVSMVRVHNYGGSGRVHTNKGVRLMEMTVDDKLVFRGEIAENTGEVIPSHQVGLKNCENILFTEDEVVLQRMLFYDTNSNDKSPALAPKNTYREPANIGLPSSYKPSNNLCQSATTLLVSSGNEGDVKRFGNEKAVVISSNTVSGAQSAHSAVSSATIGVSDAGPPGCPRNVTSLCMMLLGTWGDTEKIGLSGIRLRDANGSLVSQYITHWYVRFPFQEAEQGSAHDISGGELERWADQLQYLFDENAETAMTLPCVRGIEIIFVFATPLPTLGLLEVANYSQGEHTFCGVKEARLFLTSTNCSTSTECHSPESFVRAYAALWSRDGNAMRSILAAHGVYEVTPEEGVSLRKAPAFLTIPRFQVYDLSLGGGPDGASSVSGPLAGGGALYRPLSQSLTASMTIRAEMSMRRARMALKPRPKWLLEYQPYLTPLLPVGYVLKLNLILCARGVSELKTYAKEWMLNPLRACTFADENGERITGRGSGSKARGSTGEQQRDGKNSRKKGEGDTSSYSGEGRGALQTECLFTALPNAIQQDAEAAVIAARAGIHTSLVQASISLVYVADTPFCLSVLSLNRALVMEGRAAWVKQIRVLMDDTLVFDSGDAGVPQAVTAETKHDSPAAAPALGDEDAVTAGRYRTTGFNMSMTFFSPPVGEVTPSSGSPAQSTPSKEEQQLPQSTVMYRTRLKPFVFFTLDSAVLEEAREEASRTAA
ncbi:protein of unknown function (DUF4457), putative [Trypanosoma equiperdum]|uniref:KATNIP domain-containing protein n=2 Tax=Trypanozoon TaxID=39700 RepID=Q38FR5_TRYB2|nr:hypothetical protein, conserved [Trypanosoma brucei brucei TREU927]EAN76355.1 hypothetical protein, conserved [Trypanosoma brucei brucei TREU927]SCU71246.1 Domain of unknown function (DUF4457), putative [Trypanosoma equiperdum]